jgi:hypothetical protein
LDKQVVLVTNGDVQNPFITFDRYDDRSLLRNNLFLDTKQNWCLEHPPEKTKEGLWVQVYLVMAMKALTIAFLMWQVKGLHGICIGANSKPSFATSLSFSGLFGGICFSHEVFILAGVPVRDAEKELDLTRAQICSKYRGLRPPKSS